MGQPTDGESIQFWADKSGNDHHAKKRAGSPSYSASGLNSKPTIYLNSASLVLENSRVPFDNWEEFHVFAVLYQTAHNQFSSIFGKTNTTGWANNNSHNFSWFLNMHRADRNGHKLWGPALNTSTGGNSYMNTTNEAIWTHDGFTGGPSVLSIRYSSLEEANNFKFIVNGQTIGQSTLTGSIKSTPTLDFVIGGRSDGTGNWKGKISEFILFDKVLDDSIVTSYLDDKWAPISPLFDSNQSTFVFEDQSGGDRPMLFYGETQNNQNLFGSTLGFDGGSNFGKIDLLDRNQSAIELTDVTLPNLLHAWWPFDGDSLDYSGNERHGQMVGNGAFGMGRFDQALDLQNGGIFRIPEEKDPGIYENFPRTLSMWVKTLAPSGNLVKWGILEDGKHWNWSIASSNGMGGWMRLGIHGANQTGKHYMVTDGKWRHLAVSMTPTGESSFSLDLYVDGRQETKFLSTINKNNFEINTQPSDLVVGGEGFSGWIDDFRIYSTMLNRGEISMILEEKTSDDLAITRGNYSLSAWIKPTDLPESNRFNFAHARFFWRDWGGDTRIDTWPHDMRKTGIPKLDPSSDRLSELFEEPVSFYALAVDNNPNTDAGWNTDYIGYDSNSISYPYAFFSDTNLTDGPWLLENENGGTAYSPDFLSSLSETPNSYASSFGTSFYDYGTQPRGFTIAHGSLAFEPGGSFAPGIFYLRAGGSGRNTFWLDRNQNLTFDEVDSGERIIRADGSNGHEKVLFLGHQIPIIATPGIENDRGLAITGKRSISSWEQNGDEPISSLFEYSLNQGEWAHVVMTVDRTTHQLSTFVNGRMVATSALQENELPEPRMGDWFIGGPGPFNSNQYFAGQIDDLRMYDDALTPEEISRIYNGGEGDIGLVGTVSAPVVTDEETVTFRIAFEKFEEGIAITGITEAEVNASLTNGEIVVGSLVSLGSGIFEFNATFTSYQQMILDLPRGAGSSDTEDTLRVLHKISRVPDVPQKEDLVHWWWLDESIGKSVNDSMGSSDGTMQGGASWTADSIFGTAVSFRNEGDYISLGSPDANLSKEQFTVSLWYKRVANSTYRSPELIGNIMLSLGGTNGEAVQIGTGTSNLEVYMNTLISSGNVQMGRGIEEDVWNHLLLSYDANSPDGYELKFYLNGQLEGESGDFGSSLVIPGNSLWRIGHSAQGRFIGEIDDVRIYSAVLGSSMATDLYNDGLSDHGLTVEPYAFDPVQDPELQEEVSIEVKFKRYGDYLSLNDLLIEDLNFSLPTPDQVEGVTMWLDASDPDSITLATGNEIDSITNKVNSAVSLYGHSTNKPDTGGLINGINAIDFDKRSDDNMEGITAYEGGRNNQTWTPATEDGRPGEVRDVFVIMVARLDTQLRNSFPFGFGWGDHFPWINGNIFWWFSDNRKSASMIKAGETALLGLRFSVTEGFQSVFKNGVSILSGPRSSPTNAGGSFFFPANNASSGYGSDWTLGEMIVSRGALSQDIRQQMEGYLAQKWKLKDLMPITHPYLSAYPNFRLLDKNGEDVDDFSFSKNEDNSSLVIGFTPSESPNRFTFKLGGSFSESSDGAVSQPLSFNLAYGRPLTRLDHLEAWWDFDDENPEVVSEYFGRFPGAFIDNNISGTLYEVTYAPGLSGSALSFPGNAWVRTTASASSLGIPSNRPRTISLWIQAQENEMNDAVIYGMGNLSGNSGGNWTGWGLRNIWYNRISSFYNHQNVKNDFWSSTGDFGGAWKHIAHIYDGERVKAYVDGLEVLNTQQTDVSTMSRIPLSFGYFDVNRTNWYATNFVGLMDDFRVYNIALSQSEIDQLYGNGAGDVSIVPNLSVDPVIEGIRGNGKLTFTRGGKPFPAHDLNASHFTVTNGEMITDSVYTDDNLTWFFAYKLGEENRGSSIIFHPDVFTDGYGQPNVSNFATSKKLYRAITRPDDIDAWWSFNRDSLRSNQVQSDSADATVATIYDAWVTQKGKFGQGLAFDKTLDDGRMKIEPNGISLNESGWTLSIWCKNFISPSTNSISTLFRGQDKQSAVEFDRYLVLRGQDQFIGFIDGDEADDEARFKSSNYKLQPYAQRGWNHLVVLGEGSRTKYFLNGIFIGQANDRDQSDVYYIGNSSGDELFAEYIDDLRIYSVSLSHADVGSIYGGGYGDMFSTIQVEENSTSAEYPKVFDLYFGKDASLVEVDDLNESWMVLSPGTINDINQSEDNSSYRISINPDTSKTLHTLEIPDLPTRIEKLEFMVGCERASGRFFFIRVR